MDEMLQAVLGAAGDRPIMTIDPALADALNAASGYSGRGRKAYTPRQYVLQQYPEDAVMDRRDQALMLRTELGIGIREADRLVDEINSCWAEEGDIRAILEYPGYDTGRYEEAVAVLDDALTRHRAMEETSIGEDVLVVDPGEFNAVEQDFVAGMETYTTPGPDEPPETDLFQDRAALIDGLRSVIAEHDPSDIGVVVAADTAYARAIEALFETEEIPYLHTTTLEEEEGFRRFIDALELLVYGATSVDDARSGCEALGISYDPRMVDARPPEEVRSRLEELREETIAGIAGRVGCGEDIMDQLSALGIAEQQPEEGPLEEMRYYIEAFPVETDSVDAGVLVADASQAGYVDRPIVLHVGMDADWEVHAGDMPWIDQRQHQQRQVTRFRRLLAGGQHQHILTQRSRNGEEVAPTVYLTQCCGITAFDGATLDGTERDGEGFGREPVDSEPEPIGQFSQSALNGFLKCPKDHELSKLTDERFRVYFQQGSIVHDFAECYVNAPEVVREHLDAVEDELFGTIAPFIEPHEEDEHRFKLRRWMELLMGYIDGIDDEDVRFEGYTPEADNDLAEELGIDLTDAPTEQEFRTDRSHGFIDLVAGPGLLVDWKTSKSPTKARKHVRSAIDPDVDEPDTQAAMYLAQHRHRLPDRPLTFRFVYVREQYTQELEGGDPGEGVVEVQYRPETLAEYLRTEDCFEAACAFSSKERTAELRDAGQEAFAAAVEDLGLSEEEWCDPYLSAERKDELAAVFQDHGIDLDPKGARITVKKLVWHRLEHLFRDDLDRFEDRIDAEIERMDRFRRDGFPRPEEDIEDLRLDRRDMLLTGDGA